MAKAKPAAAAPDTEETQAFNGLRITSQREGFRRAGRAWGKAPVDVPMADLSDEEIALLKAESMLTVEDITIEAAAE